MHPHQLSAAFCGSVKHSGTAGPDRHSDGGGLGLTLTVQPSGTKSWVQYITIGGKRRMMGLGSFRLVSLAQAREQALSNLRVARAGRDPRRPKRRPPSFRDAAAETIALRAASWRSPKSRAQWESSLAAYAYPTIGDMRIDRIAAADVLAILEPIWGSKRETAQRVRQRISAVMQWAVAHGHRPDDPASDALMQVLPRRRPPVQHHAALPYADVPAAIEKVRTSNAWIGTKLAFEFLILTATRSGEVRGATWDEIDMEAETWTVPASRMKAEVEHRVPLSPPALDVLGRAREIVDAPLTAAVAGSPLVFPSIRGRALSDATIGKLLREHGIPAVPHGFRSSFRDWAAECTDTPHAVMEAALAHRVSSAVEAAYARSDLLARRRALMGQWGAFVERTA